MFVFRDSAGVVVASFYAARHQQEVAGLFLKVGAWCFEYRVQRSPACRVPRGSGSGSRTDGLVC
jgi:hypothetical protein